MQKKKHHHGDLRESLILAGLALLEEGGPEALTLRKCAAKAGVSHAAPAHHFNGVMSLNAAIIARGYKKFTETMLEYLNVSEDSPRHRLLAICEGYLDFSRSHGALFHLMFQDYSDAKRQLNDSVLQELNRESEAAYTVLHNACAPFAPIGGQAQGTEVVVWSLVHGYATLFASSKDRETPRGPVPDFAKIMPDFPLR